MGKCGCPNCRRQTIPVTKWDWKGRKNRHGHSFGAHIKPRNAKRSSIK